MIYLPAHSPFTFYASCVSPDPNSSGFPSLEAKAAFEAEGISLWKQLQKELAPNYEVFYFSETLRKVVSDMNELASSLPAYI